MKKIIHLIIFSAVSLFINSCQDVVEVDLENGGERLVIEASINWKKNTLGNEQQVKLSKSTAYFANNTFNPVENANIQITNTNTNDVFLFTHTANGVYENSTFIPIIGDKYHLLINLDGKIYTASETLISIVDIDSVEQTVEDGFSDEDIEITAYFTDPAIEENYYFGEFEITNVPVLELDTFDDDFSNGNEVFMRYESEDLAFGDTVTMRVYGISKGFFEYIDLLTDQQYSDGPFQTTPAQLKGNCINPNDPNEEVLGFFRLSEFVEVTKIIE